MIPRYNEIPLVFCYSPFKALDLNFALSVKESGAYPIIKIDTSKELDNKSLFQFAQHLNAKFGAVFINTSLFDYALPDNLEYIIVPFNNKTVGLSKKIIYQVTTLKQALEAQANGAFGVIAKGNESGGLVGEDSSFILFQKLINQLNIPVWVQGGIGIHTSAALIGLGAAGVVLDYQLSLFPELKLPEKARSIFKNLDGSETKVLHSHRVTVRPGTIRIDDNISSEEFLNHYNESDFEFDGVIPLGQDIGNASYYFTKYKKLKHFIFAIKESITGHIKQAQYFEPIKPGSPLAQDLGIEYPIAQGPMTRVSDVPEFALSVAEAGALPFFALALLSGPNAHRLLVETSMLMKGKTWGVGILGFISNEILHPQLEYIKEIKPPVVLIAGGRPSQAKPLEKIGIKVFLHVPSVGLLDSFLQEGAKKFVFEGRECGGHVGPLSSFVLWEKQINRLLQEEDLNNVHVFFAGGIHNALSSSMIAIMAVPLVARGAKIGVLMGSSYLFTKEVVETGAILEQFQQEALKGDETTLIESSPGHVVRCLNTPFVDYFNTKKKELSLSISSRKDIGNSLEQLNVGRLRIATKGIERKGDSLISVNPEDQLNQGLYMVGQVITLRNSIVSMKELHEDVAFAGNIITRNLVAPEFDLNKPENTDIAIIGMACIFPEAKNIDEYWKNIIQAKDSISEIPENRWNKDLYYDPKASNGKKSTSKWGGFIPGIHFDPLEFGIPPQSLAAIEPVQLLSLKVAKEALKDAGYDKKEFDRESTSVIFGVESGSELAFGYELRANFPQYFGDIPAELDQLLPKLTEDSFPGVLSNVISGRIANRLDLGGKNYTVDAACGSSLAAIDLACQELLMGRANMVVAGASDLHNSITDYLKFSSAQALTSSGRCKTFDQSADGISLGEGIGVVILKRLEDALQDGDRIYSIIKSVGGSSDGKSLGLTAPNKKGQLKAFERAYHQAGVSSSEVGLMEAHGTGTAVGDKTEISSMTEFMSQSGALPATMQLGSVKTQIGHTKCAAGLAGLIRTSLSIYHGIKPPTLNLNQPNAYYNFSLSPFVFNDKATPWLSEKRVAGLSAFGFGGTNFHAVLKNHMESPPTSSLKEWPMELFVFRADNEQELKKLLETVKGLIKVSNQISLKDLSYTLAKLNQKPVKVTIVAGHIQDLNSKVDSLLQGKPLHNIFPTKKIEGKIAFLFSGQGSQRVNMARDLFVAFPEMRTLLTNYPQLEKILFPPKAFDEESIEKQKEAIKDTRNAQPLLGIVDYAIAKFLISLGIMPDMLAGHSYGELPALCLSGVIREKDLVEISQKRASSIMEAIDEDPGAMVAVSGDEAQLKKILEGEEGVSIVNYNAPLQQVIAGSTKDIDRICNKLKALNKSFKRLEVACAFHSPLIAEAETIFKETLKNYTFGIPQIPVWSNTTAGVYPSTPELIKKGLSEHLVKPVRFSEEIQNIYEAGVKIFIETGSGNVLSKLTQNILDKDPVILNTEQNSGDGIIKLVDTLAQFIACGKEINYEKLFEGRDAETIDLAHIEKYAVSKTTWCVDGGSAVPLNGNLPAHAALPIVRPFNLSNQSTTQNKIVHSVEAEQIVMKYLDNVQAMIKSQHEVVMGYLGNSDINYNPIPTASSGLQQATANKEIRHTPVNIITEAIPEITFAQPALDVQVVLLETVSEKTGYPVEMLDLDMGMEADLSIDSIKRIEVINALKQKMGGFNFSNEEDEDVVEKLASIKTLKGLMNWLTLKSDESGLPQHKIPSVVAIVPKSGTHLETHSLEKITVILLESISEKTGYPAEMLDLNMDMEADLSIDSIKRVEIINVIKSKITFPLSSNTDQDDIVEKLASIKTLQGLIDWIFNSLEAAKPEPEHLEILEKKPKVNEIQPDEEMFRFGVDFIKSKPIIKAPDLLKGKRIAITDDGGLVSKSLKKYLENEYAIADIVTEQDSLTGYDGFIALELFNAPKRPDINTFFSSVQKLDYKEVSWIFAVTDIKRHLEESLKDNYVENLQGYSGFLNSLNKEWKATCRTINLEDLESVLNASSIIANEFHYQDSSTQSFYKNGERYINELRKIDWNTSQPIIRLNKDSVVLVLGGAQGITAEILKELSLEMPCNYILVGRSPMPEAPEDDIVAEEVSEIRKILLSREKFASPSALEQKVQRIYKRNQILLTINALEKSGSKAHYYSLDLTDEEALIQLLAFLYQKHGKIDGVIHAIGYLDDKFFHKKTQESFKKVFSTKVAPLKVLSMHLRKDTQFCVLFSSIASVMGNKGQVDYAAANSVLDQAAAVMNNKINGRVVAINWGPWKGKGMISEALEKDLLKRGVTSIPLSAGASAFVKELKFGKESQIILMTRVEELIEA